MPEINSKRNRQKGNSSKKKQKNKSPKSSGSKKKNDGKNASHSGKSSTKHKRKRNKLITGDSISWGSTEEKKEEPTVTRKQWYIILGVAIFLFLFMLWAFVPDRQTLQRRKAEKKAEAEYQKKRAETKAEISKKIATGFQYATILNSSSFSVALKEMHEGEFDRIMLVAFDDSTREAEANAFKVKLFKKCESLAKSMPRKALFKRYDAEDLPLIILFDCGNPNDPAAENVCKQIIGDNIPNQLIFRSQQQPRQLPNDYKSQKQILQYLYDLMQPAVKYLEELADAEDFVANDGFLNTILFGTDRSGTYDQIADILRDFARFGRTKNPAIIESFDLEAAELPTLLIWRTFGHANPQIFTGNLSNSDNVRAFVMNNYLPIFGEFTPQSSKNYMKRGLPILWIAYNPSQRQSLLSNLLSISEAMAHRYLGHLTFAQLDVKNQPQIASNFGLDVKDSSTGSGGEGGGTKKKKRGKRDGDGDGDGDGYEDGYDDDDDEDDELDIDDIDDEDMDDDDEESQLPQAFIMNQIAQVQEIIDMENIEASITKVIDTYMRTLRAHRGEAMPELQEELDNYEDEYAIDDDDDEDDFLEDDIEDDDDDEDEVDIELGDDEEEEDIDDDDESDLEEDLEADAAENSNANIKNDL